MEKIDKKAVLDIIQNFIDKYGMPTESAEIELDDAINALPTSDGWISVETVPLNVDIIELDTLTGDVIKCKYTKSPDQNQISRYHWMSLPKIPNK